MPFTNILPNQTVKPVWPRTPGFLKSLLFAHRYVSVCPPPRPLITSNVIWCDIGHVWLLLSINWMGMALVTQHTRQRYQSRHHTNHKRRNINYLAVATRRSTSVIKVSGRVHSNKFKRKLGFSFIVIILA